ncbi:hypothetical protein [Niabella hibiscisoli]|uniref:hypothetical protein n=1 Tax=Niabella hibiscisoli TaxID=1825928 RepID=UPI001F0FDD57|nr:hypothetical protein [Niabella hibiscisoli]MCH5721011.1 hypothetical protein [Niabella hibiscisoli]
MSESREHIRNRMLHHAARIWGYPETEDTSSFDPLVNLLMSVNAAELERLSNEIHHSRTRVMDRIMQLLAPDVLTGPHQASAILNANSLDDTAVLSPREQFFITQPLAMGQEANANIDVYFTPVDAFFINACSVKYMAAGNKFFRYTSDSITRELMAVGNEQQFLPNATLWVALDNPRVSLKNTQFYFQYRSEIHKDIFYNQLKNTRWTIDDTPASTRKGYNRLPDTNADWYAQQIINQQASVSDKFMKLVKQQYEHYFISVTDSPGGMMNRESKTPDQLKEVFGPAVNSLNNEKLRWIKIIFPENITGAMLEEVSVFANAFPVVNRRLHEMSYRLQEMMNVIPLLSEENQFFDIDAITDDSGRKLHVREQEEIEKSGLSIVMRNGGAGRFDERDAQMVIENLVQLLRDESAAFSNIGKDLVAQEVKNLQQSITKIEQLVGAGTSGNATSFTPYLMVRNNKQSDSRFLYISYWSTNGATANGVRAGTRLQSYRTSSVKASSAFLLTPTLGGKNRLSQTDSVVAYKYALLSKDRVMSKEDIKLYCQLALGNMVRDVSIAKGFMISAENTSGFKKTIDVTITIDRKSYDEAKDNGELINWEKDIALQLDERSMAFIPFRVFVKSIINNSIAV